MIGIVLALLLGGASLSPLQAQVADGLRKFIPPVPTPASFISDARHVLTDDAHAALDAKIRELQAGGYGDIAIAIIPDIGDYSPNQVAVASYRAWRVGSVAAIGSAHRDVGALILIVPKELSPNKKGQCYIAPGIGAEGIITDAASGAICRDAIIPFLKQKDYPAALTAGLDAIALRLKGDEGLAGSGTAQERQAPPPPEPSGRFGWWLIPGGIASMLAGMFGITRWRRNRPRTCSRCGRQMHRLGEAGDDAQLEPGQVVEEQLKSVDYDVWECDCGEHLVLPYRSLISSYSQCRQCSRRTAKAKRTVVEHASTTSSGLANDHYTCKACSASWLVSVTLPMLSTSSGGSGSSGGGGGGSSFGGSGSSSGGGGGSSY